MGLMPTDKVNRAETGLITVAPRIPLKLYDAACQALSLARSVDEVREISNRAEAMRAYARQARNKELEIDAAEIRIRAERRLGELIAAQKETIGLATGGDAQRTRFHKGTESPPTLAGALGTDAATAKKLSSRAQKLAAVPEDEFEKELGEWRGRVALENERVTTNLLRAGEKHVRGTFGTGENEWYTPPEYLDKARNVMGDIDLDPASSEVAQKQVAAQSYFTKRDDGLEHDWRGRVWLNPPYAQPAISHFVSKLVAEYKVGHTTSAILLTHNYSDTAWFQEAAEACDAICFTRGRIKFYDLKGNIAAPTQGQTFFYFGTDVSEFISKFLPVGICFRRDGKRD